MISEDELRRMSPYERAELAHAIAAIDGHRPAIAAEPGGFAQRHRGLLLLAIVGCCVVLAAWTGVLAVTLPRYYRAGDWRGAWVGFDLALLIAFVATAWAAWRHRQLVIICLVVLATLLCCDAWFDVTLDLRTSGFLVSLLMAVFVELPLAALAAIGARRLMRLTFAVVGRLAGAGGAGAAGVAGTAVRPGRARLPPPDTARAKRFGDAGHPGRPHGDRRRPASGRPPGPAAGEPAGMAPGHRRAALPALGQLRPGQQPRPAAPPSRDRASQLTHDSEGCAVRERERPLAFACSAWS